MDLGSGVVPLSLATSRSGKARARPAAVLNGYKVSRCPSTHSPTETPTNAMSNIPTVEATHDEKTETAPEWMHPNGSNGIEIERKFNDAGSKEFASRVIVERKVKRSDDGLLEIVCGWIVDHQIGI